MLATDPKCLLRNSISFVLFVYPRFCGILFSTIVIRSRIFEVLIDNEEM